MDFGDQPPALREEGAARPQPDPWTLRRPVVGLAAALALGVSVGLRVPLAPGLLFAGTLALWGLALLSRRSAGAGFWLAGTVAGLGWIHATLAVRSPSARELSALLARPAEHVALIGVIGDEPVARTGPAGPSWTFPLRVEGFQRTRTWQRATGVVQSRLRGLSSGAPPRYGERWLLSGMLTQQPSGLDAATALPGYVLQVERSVMRRLSGGGGSALYAWCLRRRQACAELLGRGLAAYPAQLGLLRAMLLGCREEIPEALYRDFSVTGKASKSEWLRALPDKYFWKLKKF